MKSVCLRMFLRISNHHNKIERNIMENHGINVIHLTGAEEQSGYDRLTFVEDLVRQLPENHEGRNSWILNYSNREDANKMRADRGIKWDAYHQAAETSKQHSNEQSIL